jgi:hypothetical protein
MLLRLNAGDELAVKQLFIAYGPFMRTVIHRCISGSLQAKFDSADRAHFAVTHRGRPS